LRKDLLTDDPLVLANHIEGVQFDYLNANRGVGLSLTGVTER